ncbi:MAG: uracil-DNA glycosylase family protein [Dermatophilaceae bacterium]
MLKWNVVPWTPTGSDGRWAAPRVSDLEEARPALVAMLELLSELRAIITFGTPALTGLMRALTLNPPAEVVPVLGVPHPSQRNTRNRQESQRRIASAFEWASCRAHDGPPPPSSSAVSPTTSWARRQPPLGAAVGGRWRRRAWFG